MFRLPLLFLYLIILLSSHLAIASEQLIIEPDAGRSSLLTMINQSKSSIDVVMYGFTDKQFIDALIRAKKSGKTVRVLLEPQPYKSDNENEFAFKQLKAANVNLQTPNPDIKLTHQKTILVDQKKAIIMTFNLTHSSFKNERNFALIIDDPAIIEEIYKVFIADSQHKNIAVNQPRLIWSPQNSRKKLIDFINNATSTIKIYAQDISDYQIIGTLAKAARSGKHVKIIMSKLHDTTSKKIEFLRKSGVEIHFDNHYLIHAKVIIVDSNRAILGSINFTRPSINDNRELAVMTEDPQVVKELANTFNDDWSENPFERKTTYKKTPEYSHILLKELLRITRRIVHHVF